MCSCGDRATATLLLLVGHVPCTVGLPHVRDRGGRQTESAGNRGRGASRADAGCAAPPRPGRRGALDRGTGGVGHASAPDRGRARGASADGQRGWKGGGRSSLGELQTRRDADGTVWIVFNGEIYNHAELRPELEQRGHCYRTRSDTETILHLYEEEGERCVERLQGMFAFALWDRKRGRLLLARDRLGIKPLYYAWSDHELVFASEIKAILAGGSIRPALNEAIIPEFLATGFVAGEETFFRGVHKLLPGRTLS